MTLSGCGEDTSTTTTAEDSNATTTVAAVPGNETTEGDGNETGNSSA
eukprot:CAMPEP_0197648052 /NCGR_PEP_ID=MMETSP1338-20131121/27384_1 /TAXON_ID=43686 ORGANISM="Pelagodinium beii, Strain RCC1491" /NCGR_SAMPLE_ID=MMETSP1338 /ASSEMBLY_ACC=CAM_ASM_000754 /LENGTH=46 /DNA_ID= /DNA_START= /DNA_END= /DNA_ORIENTATION=